MTIKRISLITPPYHAGVVEAAGTWLNLGFVYIAGALRCRGYEVDYYDAMSLRHDWPDIQARIIDFAPQVVASTAFTASAPDALKLLELAKQIDPAIVTILGNVHATFCYEDLLANKAIDYIVRGEGEITLPNLLDCLNAKDSPNKVAGLAYHEADQIIVTPAASFITNLDALTPAWDLVEWPIYSYHPKPGSTLAIVSSARGCLQNCSFCSQQLFWQRTWRARTAKNFVDELQMLNREYGVNVVMLADEIPTQDKDRWRHILDMLIERQLGVKLLMETRVDNIIRDEDILDKYRLAGVEHIYVGVEAGSQALLNLFKKGTKVEQSKRAIDLINQADIVSETSFVLGMPDETPESIAQAIELAKLYNPDMAFFLAIAPWPYADLYPALKDHIATHDYRKYNLVEPVVKPRNMELTELEKQLGLASRNFYMHKFKNLAQLSDWKQKFMLEVFKVLVNNSYLAGQMQEMGQAGQEMPPELKKILALAAKKHSHQAIAPIP